MTTSTKEPPKTPPPPGADKALTVIQATKNIGNKQLAVSTRVSSVEAVLRASADKILQTLPKHLSADRMVRLFLREIRSTPKLLDCTPESLFAAMSEAASLGLETDGVLGHAYLIPYGPECQLIAGYKGLLDLARRRDRILIKTRCVYPEDHFEFQEGDDDFIRHKPNEKPDADLRTERITHVYLIAKDEHGLVICRSVWARNRVEAHKEKYSQAWRRAENGKKDSPWHTNWDAMARKTVIRDAIARGELPVSAEIQRLASREEAAEAKFGDDLRAGLVIDVTNDAPQSDEVTPDDREPGQEG